MDLKESGTTFCTLTPTERNPPAAYTPRLGRGGQIQPVGITERPRSTPGDVLLAAEQN